MQGWRKMPGQEPGIRLALVLLGIFPATAKATPSPASPCRSAPLGLSAPYRPRPLPWRELSSETPISQCLPCNFQLGLKTKSSLVPLTLLPQIASEELDLSVLLSFPRVVSCFLFACFFSFWLCHSLVKMSPDGDVPWKPQEAYFAI